MARIRTVLLLIVALISASGAVALEKKTATFSLSPEAYPLFQSAVSKLSNRDFDAALADLTQAIKRDPKAAILYSHRAQAYREKGDIENAINDCTRAIKLEPTSVFASAALNIRGAIYYEQGKYTAPSGILLVP
jgi:Tfp pilus assembly protein PilF